MKKNTVSFDTMARHVVQYGGIGYDSICEDFYITGGFFTDIHAKSIVALIKKTYRLLVSNQII